ncbi:unnamed protein product [Oppiella nova]|uniref:Fibrinogen C-terminal domain-containing protein n=1 Tax=Oppiella nova TaxID=334625 RepID=A0A7R9LMQ1_9ACAR|nr:unnamed protein product [Oppiella nova]CAG2164549.1 unnamed protein product [Oppiella nova]
MKLITTISFTILLLTIMCNIGYGLSQKGRKRDLLEDIHKTVNTVWASVDKNDQRVTSLDTSLTLISNRVEKIIDSIEHNKLNHKFLDEKLDRLETKIKSIEESMNTKINTISESVDQIAREVKRIDGESDGKLRKIMNIISDTYELSKDTTILLKGRSGGSSGYIGNGDNESPDQMEEMQKKLLEQMSILEISITQQVSNVAKIGKETMTSLDNINLEMLTIRDECTSRRQSTQQTRSDSFNAFHPTLNAHRDGSHTHQCPTVNMTVLKHQMETQLDQISVTIENEMTIMGSKLEEYMSNCNSNTPNNNKARSLPPQDIPPIIVNTSSLLVKPTFTRKTISLAKKPTSAQSGCQHSSPLLAPKSCSELYNSGSTCDGIYVITIANTRPLRVYCDMSDNGGGWTVILRRGDFGRTRHRISFEQSWNGYKGGFGDMDSGEFWLGLDNIYQMTANGNHILQVDLESFDGEYVSIVYDGFRLGGEADNYRLHLGPAIQSNGTIAQALVAHNSSMFSTHDRNNNVIGTDNCAAKLQGGWWFHNCHSALLTAPYYAKHGRPHVWQGIQWHSWKHSQHLKAAIMKIKPKL